MVVQCCCCQVVVDHPNRWAFSTFPALVAQGLAPTLHFRPYWKGLLWSPFGVGLFLELWFIVRLCAALEVLVLRHAVRCM